ncbi:hypothetical protein H0H81_011628 [Sphagnurus paluster]|uniref:Very-long-chain (3R)-3-hydroxyacyl-CoA dehydratase n=1 Tax=Sphagnurus paluster TaxID=117069 RepID=A0A9P7KI89_9AGAR|nr:hypothetical protein H0H81_011628 [Sphagnurus paluster]
MASSTSPSKSKPKKPTPAPVKFYLVLYNLVSAAGWSYLLFRTLTHLFASGTGTGTETLLARARTAYESTGAATRAVQSLAALEVLHVLLGWVRSPLGTTAAQVASRLFLVWGVLEQFVEVRTNPLYASMLLSWSLTEVIRYSFYACALLGHEPRALLFLRYTTFYVLYPTGASSEALLIYATLPLSTGRAWQVLDCGRALLFGIWWPGLYVMYTYMMAQRRKVLGKGKGKGAKAN